MQLPFGFGDLDWSDWLRGLIAAFVGGGASAFTGGLVVAGQDSTHFAMGSPNSFKLMAYIFLASGASSAMAFLRQKPVPDLKTITTTVITTGKTSDLNPIVVTKVQETHVEPVVSDSTGNPGSK